VKREALDYWARTLETDPEKIRKAVQKVGPVPGNGQERARHRRRLAVVLLVQFAPFLVSPLRMTARPNP
jgi:hypothetical protein